MSRCRITISGSCPFLCVESTLTKKVIVDTLLLDDPAEAAALLRKGKVVAFPTETVYGLGADVFDESALRRVFEAKGRPADNPLIVHLASSEGVETVARDVSEEAKALIDTFFPGPLTLVLHRQEGVPYLATGGLETVGVRVPSHPVARAFLESAGRPVAAPSANRSGRPSPTHWSAVVEDLHGRIDAILRGGHSEVGLESTVVDMTAPFPVILRPGAVTLEQLLSVVPNARLSGVMDDVRRSPGTRYRHYAPEAVVVVIDHPRDALPGADAAYIGLNRPRITAFGIVELCRNVDEYAERLFAFFRHSDTLGIRRIYCEAVPRTGLGVALMDRLDRAAAANPLQYGT
jgi:L-threonylcarbamoyladenylate synthase